MLIGVIYSNNSLSPRMFLNRMNIFHIAFLQFINKSIEIIIFKIKLRTIAAKGNNIRTYKLSPTFKRL